MNENLAKFNYTGDKPSPIVKAQRMADAARYVAIVPANTKPKFGEAVIKAPPKATYKKKSKKKAKK